MPSVNIRDTESFDGAMRRLKRMWEKAGIPAVLRKKEYYEKPTWCRKRAGAAAVKRYQKKLQKDRMSMMRDNEKTRARAMADILSKSEHQDVKSA